MTSAPSPQPPPPVPPLPNGPLDVASGASLDVATSGPAHRRRIRGPVIAVAAVMIVVMSAAAIAAVPRMLPGAAPAPPQAAANGVLPVVTYTPTPEPTAASVLRSGADLGKPVGFRTDSGTGRLTVSRATWTAAGRMAPPSGKRYLVVTVQIECGSGSVQVSPLDLLAGVQPASGTEFGPALADPLPGITLTAGHRVHGEVGFVIAPATTAISWVDGRQIAIAHRQVPAP